MSTFNKFWIEFIELYKSFPALWKKDSEDYSNRHLKKRAYDMLIAKYREIDKDANIFLVKKKINNMRTCFRRELNKMRRSEQTALTSKDIYIPSLWYFQNMEFLIDEEDEDPDVTQTKLEAVEEVDVMDDEYLPSPTPQQRKRKIAMPVRKYEKPLRVVQQQQQTQPTPPPPPATQPQPSYVKADRASALSASWEAQFRDLDGQQKLYANRMINEVLYQGALGKLQESSYKLLEMAIDDPNGQIAYSPERETETQYYLADSSENEEEMIQKVKERKRPRSSK